MPHGICFDYWHYPKGCKWKGKNPGCPFIHVLKKDVIPAPGFTSYETMEKMVLKSSMLPQHVLERSGTINIWRLSE